VELLPVSQQMETHMTSSFQQGSDGRQVGQHETPISERELVDVATGKRYRVEHRRRHHRMANAHQRRAPQGQGTHEVPSIRSDRHGTRKARTRLGMSGPLLVLAGAVGLFLVLQANPDFLVPVLIALICIGVVLIGASVTATENDRA